MSLPFRQIKDLEALNISEPEKTYFKKYNSLQEAWYQIPDPIFMLNILNKIEELTNLDQVKICNFCVVTWLNSELYKHYIDKSYSIPYIGALKAIEEYIEDPSLQHIQICKTIHSKLMRNVDESDIEFHRLEQYIRVTINQTFQTKYENTLHTIQAADVLTVPMKDTLSYIKKIIPCPFKTEGERLELNEPVKDAWGNIMEEL